MMEENKTVAELCVVFDTFLSVERNLSPRTREAYQYDLKWFFSYYASVKKSDPQTLEIDSIVQDDIRRYMTYLQSEKKYKSSTLSRCLVSIRVFYDYLLREKIVIANPAQHIFNPKLSKQLPVYLIESELKDILSSPNRVDPWGKRDYAILVCLGLTGMRRQELVGLNIENVDFLSKTLKVFGKGAKERLIPMNVIVEDALQDWLANRPISPEPSAVFINFRFKRRLTGRAIWDIVKHYLLMSGIPKKHISPHKLRHTFATLLHMNSIELIEIQKLLGHASIASTQIYTHTNVDHLRLAVESLEHVIKKKK